MMSRNNLTLAEIEDYLQNNIANILSQPKENIDINSSLMNYGFDSLHIQHFIATIEDGFHIKIDNDLIINFENIKGLASYVLESLNEQQSQPDLIKINNCSDYKKKNVETTKTSYTDFKTYPSYLQLKNMQAQLGDNIFFDSQQGTSQNTCIIDGKKYINFTSYNYLGLASHPEVISASCDAIKKYGTSVSASRLVSGQKIIHLELENELAKLLGVEDAIVFTSGHATNVMTIAHLYGSNDLILHDELAHNSLVLGSEYSKATRISFPHNDWEAVDNILTRDRSFYKRVLIIIEGIYSMDGDIPNLNHFINVKNRHDCWLMVDEAHSMGVLGKTGRGISEYSSINPHDVEIWMGTLSKSFASCGGYIAGTKELIEYLKYTCPGFVFSVGLTPSNTAAALSSLRIMTREPERIELLSELSLLARKTAILYGFDIGLNDHTPILPIILGDSQKCINISRRCFNQGINIKPIIYIINCIIFNCIFNFIF